MASNDEEAGKEVKMFSDKDRYLSKVSSAYDVGNKGFLTETERQMRGMDSDNLGHLTNAQVSAVVNETLALREKTDRMKTWIGILGVFVIILALSNLGTAFAAAWLAKDTTVDESTGQLRVKDSDTPVTVQAYGQTSNIVLQGSVGCMDREEAAKLWNGVMDGTTSALTVAEASEQADPSMNAFFGLSLSIDGSTWNETMACMPVSGDSGNTICIDFTDNRCDAADSTGRALGAIDHHTRRKLFHAVGQGHRDLTSEPGDVAIVYNTQYTDNDALTGGVDLGLAGDYVILTKAGISTVPQSAVTGNIGVSPISAGGITGFVLSMHSSNAFATAPQITGNAYAANYIGGTTSSDLTTAVLDMQAAYTDAVGRANSNAARINLGAGLLGGAFGGATTPLTPGVYTFGSDVKINSELVFDGMTNENSVFVIQMTGSLKQAANLRVNLTNGAQAKNIFWAVAGVVEVGAGSHMEGILLCSTAVTFITGSSLNGRILAQTFVALQMATINEPS
jgi:hypothetical protein